MCEANGDSAAASIPRCSAAYAQYTRSPLGHRNVRAVKAEECRGRVVRRSGGLGGFRALRPAVRRTRHVVDATCALLARGLRPRVGNAVEAYGGQELPLIGPT